MNEKAQHTSCHSGWQAVHFAAELPDTSRLAALLEEDGSLAGSVTRHNKTPLIVAAALANVNAVKVLLPRLDAQDVCLQDSDGLNALYYAVRTDNSNGNKIALMLLKMNNDISQHECSNGRDALPYRVVMNRNRVLLEEMLKLGLDPHYFYQCELGVSMYQEWCAPGAQINTITFAGFCVEHDWSEGLELVIAAEKKRCTFLKGHCDANDIFRFLCPSKYYPNYYEYHPKHCSSAWNLVFKTGSVACFEVMMKEGMILRYEMNDAFRASRLLKGIHVMPVPRCFCGPLTLLLSTDMWKKQDLLKKLLQLESCEAEVSKSHPLTAAACAILDSKGEHSIDESIQMLLDHGFTFNFNIIGYHDHQFCWMTSITMLISLAAVSGLSEHVSGLFEIVDNLLNRSIGLPVTTDAVALACKVSVKYPTHNPMFMMKYIARQPLPEIQQAYESMSVAGHIITTTRQFEDERPDQMQHTEVHDWFVLAQLFLKGVRVDTSNDEADLRRNKHNLIPKIQFSVLMLSDADRNKLLGNSFLADAKDPYELSLAARRISSLQGLCRKVIRDQIGFPRLIREPVPRCVCPSPEPVNNESTMSSLKAVPTCVCSYCGHSSGQLHIPDNVAVEESWEISSIEQLPIPKSLKDFLRFKPDLREYCEFYFRQTSQGNT